MRPPSREEIRIRNVAERTCSKKKDFNGMRDLFAELNIEYKVIDGRTWVLCDDRVLSLLENQQKRYADVDEFSRDIVQRVLKMREEDEKDLPVVGRLEDTSGYVKIPTYKDHFIHVETKEEQE